MSDRLIDAPEIRGMTALSEVSTSTAARRIGGLLLLLFLVAPVALTMLPWRQSVVGGGRVVGYAPLDRQLNIEAPVGGRVREWFVVEGSQVKAGDKIARISDNDPEYLDALKSQLEAARQKLTTADMEKKLYGDVTTRFESVRSMATQAAENGVEVSRQKVLSEDQELAAMTAALGADKLQYERIGRLLPQGLASSREYELAEQKYKESLAKKQKAEAGLAAAKSDLAGKKNYLGEVTSKAEAEVHKAEAEVQKATGKMAETRKEIQDLEVKVRRQNAQDVVAPRDGTIFRLVVNQGAEQVKEGDAIAVMVPDAADLAVELLLDGNDIPLVHPGDTVRLQFEGWPAVQFVGWPSVAIGSFGGRVALVDSTDNGKGKFRVVVRPDDTDPWPSGRYLRQGVRAKGWVLLREVRLGYEIWRRLNGFPQVIATNEPASKGSEEESKDKVKVKRPK
jgi:adhesin transport system membrane fusion protein